jgi:predicted ATP-grasp superfamily ATP-dependent carboligase
MAVRKDKKHKWNPSLELVGFLLSEEREHIRVKGHRVGRVEGKLEHIVTEEKKIVFTDNSSFIKFYIDSQALNEFIELSISAQRVLVYVLNKITMNEDDFYLGNEECTIKINMDKYSFYKAMRELLDRDWIYLTEYTNRYFINLCFVCKGNRETMYHKFKEATK